MPPVRCGVSHLALLCALAAMTPATAARSAESVLHSFSGGTDGGFPSGAVTGINEGVLYGVTAQGGDLSGCGGQGCGVVYELDPPATGRTTWTEQILYQFKGGADGAVPLAGLLLDKTGALYGTTSQGGGGGDCHSYPSSFEKGSLIGCGTIFKLTPPARGGSVWTETVLHRFNGHDGRAPTASLLMEKTGALYGVTKWGGIGECGIGLNSFDQSGIYGYSYITGCGTAFRLTPPTARATVWTETILHRFVSESPSFDGYITTDAAVPLAGLVTDRSGTLYGTTFYGGEPGYRGYRFGTVFSLSPVQAGGAWKETHLYDFSGSAGLQPAAGLYRDETGALYGTTTSTQQSEGYGTVFKLTPPSGGPRWASTVLYTFAGGTDGATPLAGLTADPATGMLYGVTSGGGMGTSCSCGTVFALAPPATGEANWQETILHRFGRGRDGVGPEATMIMG
jgi:hypothetical protein